MPQPEYYTVRGCLPRGNGANGLPRGNGADVASSARLFQRSPLLEDVGTYMFVNNDGRIHGWKVRWGCVGMYARPPFGDLLYHNVYIYIYQYK